MPEDTEQKPFYTKFQISREVLGKNLPDIADSTKINIKYLEAIESGDFDILPNVYIRLFLRTYAEILQINPEKILDEYNAYMNISKQQLKTSGVTYIKKRPEKKAPKIKIEKTPTITNNKSNKTEYSTNYFFKPKKMFLLLISVIFISILYAFLYYLGNIQRNKLKDTQINSNLVKEYNENIILNTESNIKLKIINNAPTKMRISYKDSFGRYEILCNDDIEKKEDLYKYDINQNDVYFQIYNVKHISEISINDNSILNFLDKNDEKIYLIKGHINRLENSLNIIFYNK